MTEKLTLMAIFAHPDDEAFGTGGSLTKYAQEGVEVHLVMATLGEAGQLANPAITLKQPMSMLREAELRQACAHYGLKQLHLLGYMDGQTTLVPPSEAVFKVVKLMRQLRPQVVISFGPEGIYGHFDHLAVHRWATAAVELANEADRWPELGAPHAVQKFYHRAMPQEQIKRREKEWGRRAVLMDGIPFPFTGYPLEQITTTVDVSAYVEAKIRGIRCHASQINPDLPVMQADFDWRADSGFWQESFILAYHHPDLSLPAMNGRKEDDLFAGLR